MGDDYDTIGYGYQKQMQNKLLRILVQNQVFQKLKITIILQTMQNNV